MRELSGKRAHCSGVRGIALTTALSFGAHLAIAAAFLVPRAAAPADPGPQLAGETFELPAPESPGGEVASTAGSPGEAAAAAAGSAPGDGDAPARPARAVRKSAAHRDGESGARDSAAGSTGSSERYGATGDRSAGDLATAFTRGFPQAASADPAWKSAPLGPAGSADVVLTLSDTGHIESTDIQGAPPAALASGIRRTLALIKMRPFVARGKTTRLHITASIASDAVHDGLHGDVFAIGGSFAGAEGSAFFALAIGRRIDLRIHQR